MGMILASTGHRGPGSIPVIVLEFSHRDRLSSLPVSYGEFSETNFINISTDFRELLIDDARNPVASRLDWCFLCFREARDSYSHALIGQNPCSHV